MDEGHARRECARANCLGCLSIILADRFGGRNHLHQHGPYFTLDATVGLIKGAAAVLSPASPFYLYGPYKREGFATAPSNQAFDRNLRDRKPTWGLRDLEAVVAIARSVRFSAPGVTEMPANNLSVLFRRM